MAELLRPFHPGDPGVVRRIGKGIVQEARRQGRYVVLVGAAALVCDEDDLTAAAPPKRGKRAPAVAGRNEDDPGRGGARAERSERRGESVDLHGLTVEEALQRVDERLNAAMLAGTAVLDVIHGKGGGRIRAALHRHLRAIPSVRRFEIDSRNAGVTHVYL